MSGDLAVRLGRCPSTLLEYWLMTDSEPIPDPDSGVGSDDSPVEPRLFTVAEAAEVTGLSRKVITGRMDRETLRVVRDESGTRRVPRAELVRAGLLDPSHPAESDDESPGHPGELVRWQDLYEREYAARVDAEAAAGELRVQLAAIANAGPIRAMRLRRQLRAMSATDTPLEAPPALRTA